MGLGALLILAALLFLLYNQHLNQAAGESVDAVMPELVEAIEEAEEETAQAETEALTEEEAEESETVETESEETEDSSSESSGENQETETEDDTEEEMTTTVIDGYEYIGYLSIPSLDLELPVMSSWSYSNLRISPCRYSGSLLTDDLVICAHNYARHFGKIKNLSVGDEVCFTDMDGNEILYEVAEVTTLAPTAVEEMTNSGYDLTLYTCTYGGKSRVTVRCNRVS